MGAVVVTAAGAGAGTGGGIATGAGAGDCTAAGAGAGDAAVGAAGDATGDAADIAIGGGAVTATGSGVGYAGRISISQCGPKRSRTLRTGASADGGRNIRGGSGNSEGCGPLSPGTLSMVGGGGRTVGMGTGTCCKES